MVIVPCVILFYSVSFCFQSLGRIVCTTIVNLFKSLACEPISRQWGFRFVLAETLNITQLFLLGFVCALNNNSRLLQHYRKLF